MQYFLDVDLMEILLMLGSLGATFIVSWFIGFERQNSGKSAGISAHVLVALGSCAIAILQQYLYNASIVAAQNEHISVTIENQRIIAQVIAGVGFIGAGVIMKSEKHIVGLTTATTLWVVCVIGLLFGSGYIIQGAIFGVIIIAFMYLRDVLRHINPFKRFPQRIFGKEHDDNQSSIEDVKKDL